MRAPRPTETQPPAQDRDRSSGRVADVNRFVARHFSLRGTLRLHRAAFGWDLLRAPLNVALAPIHLVVRLLSLVLSLCRLRGAATWLATRRLLFRSAVARQVEAHLWTDLLADISPVTPRQHQMVEDYTSTRSAVAEIVTSLGILALGMTLFHIVTPGVISLAPVISDHLVQTNAVAAFPLGQRIGGLWYGLFPPELPFWYIALVAASMIFLASLVTTFAGLVADPVQAALGIHRRRLLRLLARIEADDGALAPIAREHVLARLGDITDIFVSVLRFLRP